MNKSKQRFKPAGKAKNAPIYVRHADKNGKMRKRRLMANKYMAKFQTPEGKRKIDAQLRRLIKRSPYWANVSRQDGIDSLRESLIAIFDNMDFAGWGNTITLEILAENTGMLPCRVSRAIERARKLFLLFTEKAVFNPFDRKCECKHIEVTESFFAVLGIPLREAYRERANILGEAPEIKIYSDDKRLIVKRQSWWAKMAKAGLLRRKQKCDTARNLKAA